jgi:hypothetical protein
MNPAQPLKPPPGPRITNTSLGGSRCGQILLSAATLLGTLIVLEFGAQLLMEPSAQSDGRLFGLELPPFRLIPIEPVQRPDPDLQFDDLVVGGLEITNSDLAGFVREDPLLSYVAEENRISTNGWWQSNDLGARRRTEISSSKPPGTTRLLVFGDFFAHSSRVPQEEAFTHFLEIEDDRLEVINFGVDGFSMGQSYLRYQTVSGALNHDVALLVFVPPIDLIRDVNVLRGLIGWDSYTIMPRFEVDSGQLGLIRSPYASSTQVYEDNRHGLSRTLRDHLVAHDHFFQPALYERVPVFGRSVLGRLMIRAWGLYAGRRTTEGLLAAGSEASTVSLAIFKQMREYAEAADAEFVLVILPPARTVEQFARGRGDRGPWAAWSSFFCNDDFACFDLTRELFELREDESDRGYDGTHFGPRTNRIIARALHARLLDAGLVP